MNKMKTFCCGAAVALLVRLGAVAGEGGIELNADTPWLVATNQPEALQRALSDVERDWYKVFGHRPVILAEAPPSWRGPVVGFVLTRASATIVDKTGEQEISATDTWGNFNIFAGGVRGVENPAHKD